MTVSGHPEPSPPPWDPLLRVGFYTPSSGTPDLPTACAFGGSNTIKSGPRFSPGLNRLRSKVTSSILRKVAEWALTMCHKWGVAVVRWGRECGMAMGNSGKRARTGQIRDLIQQTDNGGYNDKRATSRSWCIERKEESILNFKTKPTPGETSSLRLLTRASHFQHRFIETETSVPHLRGLGFVCFVFCNPMGSS